MISCLQYCKTILLINGRHNLHLRNINPLTSFPKLKYGHFYVKVWVQDGPENEMLYCIETPQWFDLSVVCI